MWLGVWTHRQQVVPEAEQGDQDAQVRRRLTVSVTWPATRRINPRVAAQLGYASTLSAPTRDVSLARRSIESIESDLEALNLIVMPVKDKCAAELGYKQTLSAPDVSIEETTVAESAGVSSPDSRERRELALIFGGLTIGAVAFGSALGWLSIGSSDRTPQLAQVWPSEEAGAVPPSIVQGQANRYDDRSDEPDPSIARTSILGQVVAGRYSPSEHTGANSRVQDAAETGPSRLPRNETLLVLRPLAAKNANAAPVSRPDVRDGQAILPSPPPWDAEVRDRNKIVDSLIAPGPSAPPPKSPGISPAGYDKPPIVLIARADVLVRVLDADNNVLVDRRFQPGDSYTVPSREGLVLVSEAPDKLDITINGELIGPTKSHRPWDHIPLNAARLTPAEKSRTVRFPPAEEGLSTQQAQTN